MSILPHTVVGGAVGSLTGNLPLAIAGGILSHFILDLVPHWDPDFRHADKKTKRTYFSLFLIDLSLSAAVLGFLLPYPNLFWAALVAPLVDLEWFIKEKYFKLRGFNHGLQWQTNKFIGLGNQAWVTALGFYLLREYIPPINRIFLFLLK